MRKRADCSSIDYSNVIFSPKAGEVYHLGDLMNISWYGGKTAEGSLAKFSLYLASKGSEFYEHNIFGEAKTIFGKAPNVYLVGLFCFVRAVASFVPNYS